jgi:hypothetical protein
MGEEVLVVDRYLGLALECSKVGLLTLRLLWVSGELKLGL